MPTIDPVTNRLAHEVVGDREGAQAVVAEQLPLAPHVAVVGERLLDLEVVAPARQLQAVVAIEFCFLTNCFQGKVGPLAGKQGNWTWHG